MLNDQIAVLRKAKLGKLVKQNPGFDPQETLSAVFSLIHEGKWSADLESEELSFSTTVSRDAK